MITLLGEFVASELVLVPALVDCDRLDTIFGVVSFGPLLDVDVDEPAPGPPERCWLVQLFRTGCEIERSAEFFENALFTVTEEVLPELPTSGLDP